MKTLITAEQIQKRVDELAKEISQDYAGKKILFVGILKGSFVFLSDLIRRIEGHVEIEFLGASSYGNATHSSGSVKLTLDLARSIENQDVLVVEDIVDTGLTLHYLLENLRLRKPRSLKLCTLLLKPSKVQKEVPIDYLGFTIEDKFVIGYGLDAAEKYRNLPYLGYLEEGETT